MAIGSGVPYNEYTGNGVSTVYAFGFTLLDADDLAVTIDGVVTSAYTVSGLGIAAGGSVTFSSAPASGAAVLLERVIDLVRATDYQNNGDLQAATLNDDFNRLWLATQQISTAGDRAIRVPELDVLPALPAAASRANNILSFDSNGDPIASAPTSGTATALAANLASAAAGLGSKMVAFIQRLTGAVARWVEDKLAESISVKDFGAVGDGVADDTAAIAAAWAVSKQLDFPAGTYKVSSLPNFAYNGARIRGIGEVWINFTGTGNAMTVDNGATPGGKNYNIVIENIGINGTASCTHGLYIRGITHSTFRRIRTRNVVTAGARCEFMVSNLFDEFCHSGNEAGMTILTVNGVIFEKRGTGEQCSDCTWINPVIEGTSGDGLLMNEAAANTFIGGTSEGNGYGGGAGAVKIGTNSFGNTFIGLDMEFNGVLGDATSYHVKDSGLRTRFINPFCDAELSGLFWVAGGNSCAIDGGQVADLQIDSGVKNFHTVGVAYTGTITDNGTDTRRLQEYSVSGGVTLADSQQQVVAWTPTVSGLTVVGTPTYAGTYQKMGRLVVFTITATSTTSTANPGGATFSLPVAAGVLGTCAAASNNSGLGVGQGSGSIAAAVCYPPAWSADSSVTISGSYFTA